MRLRSDSWTTQEEKTLLNVLIKNIKSGLTMKEGYREVSSLINRTHEACAYHWQTELKHKNVKAIESAKRYRIDERLKRISANNHDDEREELRNKESVKENDVKDDELKETIEHFFEVLRENKELKVKVKELQESLIDKENTIKNMEDRNNRILELIDRTRTSINQERRKVGMFKMDENGNLQPEYEDAK